MTASNALMLAAGLGKRAATDITYYAWTEEKAVEALAAGLELGLDVNAANAHGETALHAAAYHNANPRHRIPRGQRRGHRCAERGRADAAAPRRGASDLLHHLRTAPRGGGCGCRSSGRTPPPASG